MKMGGGQESIHSSVGNSRKLLSEAGAASAGQQSEEKSRLSSKMKGILHNIGTESSAESEGEEDNRSHGTKGSRALP
jgi:hypothetical protein